MVMAKGRPPMEYERVVDDEWVIGVISDIQDRVNDNKKFKNKETGEYETRTAEEVRFVFELEGYKYKHYSRWMTLSVNKESNLYKKYLAKLVPDLKPETDFDLDTLKGMKVKTMWETEEGEDGNTYQRITQIKPI